MNTAQIKDPTGRATMSSSISYASNYHRYLYESLKPFLKGRVWEIGSGYGQYTKMLVMDDRQVLASDIDEELLAGLRQKTTDVKFIDLYDRASIKDCCDWGPDSIICLNVLEHIKDDSKSLSMIREQVARGTVFAFLMPAFNSLYGFMDEQAGHYKRYTRSSAKAAFEAAGLTVEKTFYLNPVGGVGWFVRNKLVKPSHVDLDSEEVNNDIKFFDKYCVPITAALDKVCSSFFGQSVVVIARK